MTGDRLHHVARRLLRPETCRAIVEPAIADLQYEATRGPLSRVRGYTGVCRALIAALCTDIVNDTISVIAEMAAPAAVRQSLSTLALASFVLSAPFLSRISEFRGLPWVLLPVVSVIPLAMLPGLAVAARVAARWRTATRGFVFAALGAAALLLLFIDQGVTRTNRMFRQVEGHARGIGTPAPGPRELTLAELRMGDSAAHRDRQEKAFAQEAPQRVGIAATAVAYVLIGLSLAPVGRRRAAIVLCGVMPVHYSLMLAAHSIAAFNRGLIAPITVMPHALLIGAAAIAAMRRDRRTLA
jgi:hypothetical protein